MIVKMRHALQKVCAVNQQANCCGDKCMAWVPRATTEGEALSSTLDAYGQCGHVIGHPARPVILVKD